MVAAPSATVIGILKLTFCRRRAAAVGETLFLFRNVLGARRSCGFASGAHLRDVETELALRRRDEGRPFARLNLEAPESHCVKFFRVRVRIGGGDLCVPPSVPGPLLLALITRTT